MVTLAFAYGASYLIGSIPTAYLMVKALTRTDVRTVGSGNVGATNVGRVAGKGAGAVVFVLDLAKGFAAVWWLAPWIAPEASPAVRFGCGVAAVLGHSFPVWLGCRGGKGVATTIGMLLGTMPVVAAVCVAVWAGCFAIWRFVSIGSLAAAAALPVAQLLTQRSLAEVLMGAALGLLIIVRHRQNIQRLLHGQEHR